MKRTVALLMALMMMFLFSSCSEEPEQTEREIFGEVERGTIENGRYYNEPFGIGFEAPKGWRFCDDEEMKTQLFGVEMSFSSNDPVFYDMMCIDEESGAAIYISYENMEENRGFIIEEKEYAAEEAEKMREAYTKAGLKVFGSEVETIKTGGENLYCLEFNFELNGINVPLTVVYRKTENYMARMVFSYLFTPGKNEMKKGIFFE